MDYKIKLPGDDGCCLECGNALQGRKNKKFCSLSCKNAYNNRRIGKIRQYRSEIMSKLARNYEILESLMNEKVFSISIEELKTLGFDENCMTGHRAGYRRHEECRCFDLAYCRSGSKIFGLRRIEIDV